MVGHLPVTTPDRRRRKLHRHTDSRRPQPLVDMTMIDARPPRWPTVLCQDIGRAQPAQRVAGITAQTALPTGTAPRS
jgi:hypothetical protein